jgi:Got1/Sft2-like family
MQRSDVHASMMATLYQRGRPAITSRKQLLLQASSSCHTVQAAAHRLACDASAARRQQCHAQNAHSCAQYISHASLCSFVLQTFLAGITLTIGAPATIKFFAKPKHRLGSLCFLGGTTLIVLSWTLIGLLTQAYGFWRLFSAFFPTVLQYARQIPYLSKVLDLPIVKNIINRIAPASGATLPY